MLAGATPTLINPSHKAREVRHQLDDSGAATLITDGPLLEALELSGLQLRRAWCTRHPGGGGEPFARLLEGPSGGGFREERPPDRALALLPYSSGTTGLPKGVMLTHQNLVSNLGQLLGPGASELREEDVVLCALPLCHIYGFNVVLNPCLALGATLVLLPRFDRAQFLSLLAREGATMVPLVPPALQSLAQAAEEGLFPREHRLRWALSGAAPLAPALARRFRALTGALVCQGYGMTEASPNTHLGHLTPSLNRPESIGQPLCQTECRIVDDQGGERADGEQGQLLVRGPQLMRGYWNAPEATARALRDGWYWTGDVVRRDADGFFHLLDRLGELIKHQGFSVAPAELEAVLLEHPAVRDCCVVAGAAGSVDEHPVAAVVLRDGFVGGAALASELVGFVEERLARYKRPREVLFVAAVPRTPSGKLLRRELRLALRR
jgi:acyl-CoA synthetase (AMP-forming)/AMP-acid ligase II